MYMYVSISLSLSLYIYIYTQNLDFSRPAKATTWPPPAAFRVSAASRSCITLYYSSLSTYIEREIHIYIHTLYVYIYIYIHYYHYY